MLGTLAKRIIIAAFCRRLISSVTVSRALIFMRRHGFD